MKSCNKLVQSTGHTGQTTEPDVFSILKTFLRKKKMGKLGVKGLVNVVLTQATIQ